MLLNPSPEIETVQKEDFLCDDDDDDNNNNKDNHEDTTKTTRKTNNIDPFFLFFCCQNFELIKNLIINCIGAPCVSGCAGCFSCLFVFSPQITKIATGSFT